jgi:SH3 domain-containing protein
MIHRLAAIACVITIGTVAIAQSGTVRVTAARANVRQSPNERATILTQLPYGTELELAGVEGDWYRVYVPLGPLRVEAYIARRVAAVVSTTTGASSSTTSPKAVHAEGISIGVRVGGDITWLNPVAVRAVPVVERYRTLAEVANAKTVSASASGENHIQDVSSTELTWVWVAGRDRFATVSESRPAFVASYRDAPGVNINELTPAIIKLAPAGDQWSVLTMARGRADAEWNPVRDFQEQAVKVEVVAAAVGTMNVRLAAPLAPGDYALVLRPAFLKRYPGAEVLSDTGVGLVLSLAWPFTISR